MLSLAKLTLDRDLNVVTLKKEIEVLKGEKLTKEENARVEEMVKQVASLKKEHDALRQRVAELEAMRVAKSIGMSRSKAKIDTKQDLDDTLSRIKELLDEGCMN
jgi:hypothetical protein